MHVSNLKRQLSGSPSASALGFERPSKRQKTSSDSHTHGRASWDASRTTANSNARNTSVSTQETEARKKRLQQFLAITNLASSNDQSESLRKQTVFQATQNKQRNDEEIKAELQRYMQRVDASKDKIQKELDERLRRKTLLRLKKLKEKQKEKEKPSHAHPKHAHAKTQPHQAVAVAQTAAHQDVDPLDAFMSNLTHRMHQDDDTSQPPQKAKERIFSDESKFDEEDLLDNDHESMVTAGLDAASAQNSSRREIKPVDHGEIEYDAIRKRLYVESPDISALSWSEVHALREAKLDHCQVTVACREHDIKPILKWTQCGLSNAVLSTLQRCGYAQPFPVQCQAIPVIMSGRDLICVASTGSGKTLAYILPMIRHILLNYGGDHSTRNHAHPKAVILCPTRELAQQIYSECRKFIRHIAGTGLRLCSVYGGVSITEQINQLRRGCDIIIGTPGRLIELLCTNCGRLLDIKYVSYFCLDEADRLFDLGFESQITSILQNVRPDKQLLMFSATFPKRIEKIAVTYFLNMDANAYASQQSKTSSKSKSKQKPKQEQVNRNLVQMTIGNSISAPCENVAQFVYIVENEEDKFKSLLRLLGEWYGRGNLLIFVDTRNNVDLLFSKLCDAGYFSLILHGGINQMDRDYTILDYKNKVRSILICTSIASRGLDVADLKVVINYAPPHHYEDYIHRIGRTGRANNRGVAYTFINRDNLRDELKCVPHLVKAMKNSSNSNNKSAHNITEELLQLQQQYFDEVNSGKQQMFRNCGYASKGFKFDRAELQVKKHEIERQKFVYGAKDELQLWNLNKKDDIQQIHPATDDEKKKTNGGGTAENADKTTGNKSDGGHTDGNTNGDAKATKDPLQRNLLTLKKALAAAKKKKKEIEKKKKKNKDTNSQLFSDAKVSTDLIKKAISKTIEKENKKHEKQTRDRVESIAKMISMEIETNNQGEGGDEAPNSDMSLNGKTGLLTFKLDINDYPPNVRKAVTNKLALNPLKENYNVRILQRGQFVPSGRKPSKGESSLYLEIQGMNESDIRASIQELKEILYLESQKMSNYAHHNNYGKYKVV